MANYVSNMVVCSKAFYEKYFFDTNPFGDGNVSEYIKTHPKQPVGDGFLSRVR